MSADDVEQRLAEAGMLPELRAALIGMARQDLDAVPSGSFYGRPIEVLGNRLNGPPKRVQRFAATWAVLYGALRRLDHLQDGDPDDQPVSPTASLGSRYNEVFGYYVLDTTLLETLDEEILPQRLQQLRRLWLDCILRAASGQQRDLEAVAGQVPPSAALDLYQSVAQAKAGALFRLGFGGMATLFSDDPTAIEVISFAGEVYGTLLQFSDDVRDSEQQTLSGTTLPQAYHAARGTAGGVLPGHDVGMFWRHVYHAYMAQLERALDTVVPELRDGILAIFQDTFDHQVRRETR